MIPVLLIAIPLVAGVLAFFTKNQSKNLAWLASIITLAIMVYALAANGNICKCNYEYQCNWLPSLGASFHVGLDGMAKILCLLTALTFPIIYLANSNHSIKNEKNHYALMLLSQAGLMGVFVAMDGLLFYFFWELALIPVYFLCSIWGSEKRIAATFKFFIYTFVGSLFMLVALIFIAGKTQTNSFDIAAMYKVVLTTKEQYWIFFMLFIAFAIKMPIFPFHTWQPDLYQQSPTNVTAVLSAVMVKMGLFGVIRWLIPIVPNMTQQASLAIIVFCIIGIVYASLLATKQNNIKRLIAYSSIAHIGLMCATLFTNNYAGLQGVLMQMFFHGINILGLWLVVDMIEKRTGIQKMNELGGLAKTAPTLAIFLVIIALANIGLPLTNAFMGEFLMFNALFKYNMWLAAFAGLGIIISAVYILGMIQKVFLGEPKLFTQKFTPLNINEKCALAIIVLYILVMGVYSKPFSSLTIDTIKSTIIKN